MGCSQYELCAIMPRPRSQQSRAGFHMTSQRQALGRGGSQVARDSPRKAEGTVSCVREDEHGTLREKIQEAKRTIEEKGQGKRKE